MKQSIVSNYYKKLGTKPVFIILLLFFIFVLSYYFLHENSKKTKDDFFLYVPKPKIETSYKDEFIITFLVAEKDFNLPNSLPVYTISKMSLDNETFSNVSEKLGFSKQDPRINEDPIFGTTYIYRSEYGRLRIIPSFGIVDYKSDKNFYNSFLSIPSNEYLETITLDYLIKNGFISNTENLSIFKIRPLSVHSSGHFDESIPTNVISVAFIRNVKKYPILSPTHETGTIMVNINNKHEVISVYINEIPKFEEGNNVSLLTYNEIINSPHSNFKLKSLDNGKLDLLYLNPREVRRIEIDDIKIAYLQEMDENQKFLQPIYLLKGTAVLESEERVSAVLYLPAIKNL